ncbi:unnamed protein product [Phaedon cochleariae]|uniref:MYND-type domain-containing protein n=1 Tax=Phaedon cochleariae TaxID=80249 RepID=A0A9P0GWX0_PHACE|nr:unnamed protein product [Phaedon cochleariae]
MYKREIELGFLEECQPWQVESRLFPSKVGGKPAWLNLEKLPSHEQLQCKNCQKSMIFLCQLYAPYEEDLEVSHEQFLNNFHRSLFVFICRNQECCIRNNSCNIKVLRSSMLRDNKYYPYDPPEDKPDSNFSLSKWVKLCTVCGGLAEKQCSKCKRVNYCSREHQVLDWKEGHKKECGSNLASTRQSEVLFPEWEIITETEEFQENHINEEEELKNFKNLELEGKTGTMSHISESELEAHSAEEKDKTFLQFQKRTAQNPDQVIRYKRGGRPFWIARAPLPDKIPECEHCGGDRQFEFQIMPQMLTLLKETSLDWGVLVVFTCKNSCTDKGGYREEFVFKQDVELDI